MTLLTVEHQRTITSAVDLALIDIFVWVKAKRPSTDPTLSRDTIRVCQPLIALSKQGTTVTALTQLIRGHTTWIAEFLSDNEIERCRQSCNSVKAALMNLRQILTIPENEDFNIPDAVSPEEFMYPILFLTHKIRAAMIDSEIFRLMIRPRDFLIDVPGLEGN